MTTNDLPPRSAGIVKTELADAMDTIVGDVLSASSEGASARELELLVWPSIVQIGQLLLSLALAIRCRRQMLSVMERLGHNPDLARVRTDADYQMTLTTTLGPVRFPTFAYRYPTVGGHD